MGYIGRAATNAGSVRYLDNISSGFDGSDVTFTAQVAGVSITPGQENINLYLDGVFQHPGSGNAYTISGSTITFTAAPVANTVFTAYVVGEGAYLDDATVITAKIGDDAITAAKLDDDGTGFQVGDLGVGGSLTSGDKLTVTGRLRASAGIIGALTGNATTATTLATARTIGGVSFDGSANIAVTLAATATTLATARAINGVDFNGSAAITVTAAAGTLSGNTLKSTVTASSLTSVGTLTGLSVDGGTSSLNRGNSSGDILDVRGQNTSQMKVTTTAFTVTPDATFGGQVQLDADNADLKLKSGGSGDAQIGFWDGSTNKAYLVWDRSDNRIELNTALDFEVQTNLITTGSIDCNATGNQVNDFAGGIYFSGTDLRIKYNPSNSLANSVLDVYNSSATGYGAYIQAGSSGRYVLNMRDKDGVERYVFDGAGTATIKTGPVVINSAGSDGQLYLGGTSGSNRMYLARSGGDALLWNVTSGNLKLGTNNTLALTIDSSQNATFAGTIKSDVGFRPTNGTANLLAFVDSNEFNMYNTSGVGDANRQTMHLQYTGTGSQVDIANSELVVVKGTGSTFAGSVTSPSNAKFWVRSDVYTNNDVRDSYNCDGHTHHTTGNLTYSFTTNMPSTVYCLVGSGHYGGGTNDVGNVSWEGGNLAAASCRVQFNSIINYGTGAFAAYDPEEMMLVIFDN